MPDRIPLGASTMSKEVLIEGERVVLRPVRLSDVNERYQCWMNDIEVNRFMETRFRPQSMDDIESYVQKMISDPDVLFLAIICKADNRHIGNIKLGPVSRAHRRGEMSFFIGEKDCWGKGLATEAVGLVTAYGLEEMGLIKITAGAYSTNTGSIRVFEKLGYSKEGTLKQHYFCGGEVVDRICFAKFHAATE